jgi:transposase
VCGVCGEVQFRHYDKRPRQVRDLSCGDRRVYLAYEGRRVDCARCRAVKNERLEWLADNPLYTKRFAYYVGRRCRATTVRELAEELLLDWHTVKELDKQYMTEQLRRVGIKSTTAIGIDEISVGRGHEYRIVVSDLIRGRPIWFGGEDRSEKSLDGFFVWFGPENCRRIRIAVMIDAHWDGIVSYCPRHERDLSCELHFLTGWANFALEGRIALKVLFKANKRLNIAYLLQDSFEALWSYETAGWARRFFDHWCDALKWQRLKPFEKFAAMIDAHWDGIVSYCHVDNKVSLGFVEGLNNKIRKIQGRAYGYRDEEYFRLKILTCMLDKL